MNTTSFFNDEQHVESLPETEWMLLTMIEIYRRLLLAVLYLLHAPKYKL